VILFLQLTGAGGVPKYLNINFSILVSSAILRTFFERKALANEATNWLNGLSHPTPT
jgi:hypothetical protein